MHDFASRQWRNSLIWKLSVVQGGTKLTVAFTDATTEVALTVELGRNYDVYGGAYKGWGANVDLHRIRVPSD